MYSFADMFVYRVLMLLLFLEHCREERDSTVLLGQP